MPDKEQPTERETFLRQKGIDGDAAPVSRNRGELFELLGRFEAAAGPLHLQVHRSSSASEAAAMIAVIARDSVPEFSDNQEIIIHDHPLLTKLQLQSLVGADTIRIHLTRGTEREIRRRTCDSSIGITAPAWGIAESATLVQLTRPGQPRSTSLVPSIHIAVLPLENLVADLGEAYALISREPVDSMVLISGPSKTADIEACMVHGAHGPREVHVIVICAEKELDDEEHHEE